MNYCTYCGTPLAKDVITCSNCGKVNPTQSSSARGPVSGVLPSDPPLREETLPVSASQASAPVRTTTYYNIETPAHQKAMSFTQSNIPVMPAPAPSAGMPATDAAPTPIPTYLNNPATPISSPIVPVTPIPLASPPSGMSSPTPAPMYTPYPTSAAFSPDPNAHAPKPPRKKMSFTTLIIALVVALVLIFSTLGIVGYNAVYVPRQLHAKATATVAAQQTSDAKAAGTAFANEVTQEANSQAQSNVQATATAQSQSSAYKQATSGTPLLNDPLQNSNLNDWDVNNTCAFQNNAYMISSSQQDVFTTCLNQGTDFDNFTFQVHMKIMQGDGGGLVLRASADLTHFYFFQIDSDGIYNFTYYPDINGKDSQALLSNETSTGFNTQPNAENTITIIAHKDTFSIYINKQFEMSAKDNNVSSGLIGLTALDEDLSTTVEYTDAEVWAN